MGASDKPVVLSYHAKEQCLYRGCQETEVVEVIRTAPWKAAELGRKEASKDFSFNQSWNGKEYRTKRVRPIFAEEGRQIVVVTVYVYYF